MIQFANLSVEYIHFNRIVSELPLRKLPSSRVALSLENLVTARSSHSMGCPQRIEKSRLPVTDGAAPQPQARRRADGGSRARLVMK